MDINSATKFQIINGMFVNYELNKLDIANPNMLNLLIIVIFCVVVAVTAKKEESVSKNLLSTLHTDQLRGLGIFFVVLGHLWVHVSKAKAQIVLSGDAVSLFLLLSGFGLSVSNKYKRLEFKDFCLKRLKRVMLPYWIATAIILLLDFIILNRGLSLNNLLMTVLGINTTIELRHLDYARWFVTFILLWYLLFYIFFVKFLNRFSQISLIAFSIILLPLNYYIFHFGWYQFISFPVGCLLAIHLDKFQSMYHKNNLLLFLSVIGIVYVISYKLLLSHDSINFIVTNSIPNILLAYVGELNSVIICVSAIFISYNRFIENGIKSKALIFLGKYSYEIFLIHGVFLIKYNPVIKSNNDILLVVQFTVLLLFVLSVSFVIHKTHNYLYANK